ncbi:hypothetical protein K490DRAFT_64559 [Saccharata proteae CBS 121410]|uniref:DUF7907 domain-containing protein n=1 Tax=Saccharata proteae CBS 121410 TaxID=1314787 RepID=A0A9P4HX93_9PEZI|nr:hypothetical protein K490DRAFT_64559 [Saccharata proteae CBS 121410]
MLSSIASLLFISAATALPTASTLPSTCTFKLVANIIEPSTGNYSLPKVQDYELSTEHSGACKNYAVFVPPGEGGSFYANRTTVGVSPELLEVSGGVIPGGMTIYPGGNTTVPSINVVELNCGYGTDGIRITSKGMLDYEGGSWMACDPSVFHPGQNGDVLLSYKKAGQRTLAHCADVEMIAKCSSAGTGGEGAQPVSCVPFNQTATKSEKDD